jgi:hypothetical protein
LAVPLRRVQRNLEPSFDDEGVDLFAQQAAEEVRKRKLTQFRLCLPYSNFLSMFVIASLWFGGTLPTTFAQNCSSLVNATVVMITWIAPSIVTRGSADWIYSVVMAGMSVTMCPIAISGDTVFNYAIGTWVCTLGISFVHLKPWLNAMWIFIIDACACLTLVVGKRSLGQCSTAQPFREAVQLSAISVVSAVCLVMVDRLLQQLTRLELEAHSSRNELAAAQSVLRSVCDVVVEVDDALRLREDSPELRDMLFLSQHRSLRQEDMRGFLASAEDSAKFCERVRGAAEMGPPGGGQLSVAFHVHMKDSAGITLEAEVFVVRFVNREGLDAYLLGIREQDDTYPAPGLRGSAPRGRRGSCRRGPRRAPSPCARELDEGGLSLGVAAEGADAQRLARSCSSCSSSSNASSSTSAGSLQDAKMSVWVDLLIEDWAIVGVTDLLQMCLRLSEEKREADLLPLVRNDQQERLIAFVQDVHFNRQDRVSVTFEEPVFFRTAHMRRLNLCVCATLVLDWETALCPTPQPKEVIRISFGETTWFNGSWRERRVRSEPHGTPRARRQIPELYSL